MPKVAYQIIDELDTKTVSENRSILKCISLFKKGNIIVPGKFIKENLSDISPNKHSETSARVTFNKSLAILKTKGLIKQVELYPFPFKKFIELETVSYWKSQLRGSRFKNKNLDRYVVGSTQKIYLLHAWAFNNWLIGRPFSFKKMKQTGENTFIQETSEIKLEGLEQLLKLYQESNNNSTEFVRIIKQYLLDSIHRHKSKGTMKRIYFAIQSYFDRNDSPIKFSFNPDISQQTNNDEKQQGLITLEDITKMLTVGKPSIMEKAVVLCMLHRGLDSSTFVDRFNFQAFGQLTKYFGTETFDRWDLDKCPVPVKLTRVKTGYPHRGFLERDAITALQDYLRFRQQRTDKPITPGEPIFINKLNLPINSKWMMKLIPKLAQRSGIQRKLEGYYLQSRNQKTSHELRDTLKSTLIASGVAQWVCETAIGHKVGDSYEKQDELYPAVARKEYAKAAKILNVFSNFARQIQDSVDIDGLKESDQRKTLELSHMQEQINELEAQTRRHAVIMENQKKMLEEFQKLRNNN